VFQYPNDQRAATMWFHDHTLGMTRLNVYAGPAGFYLLRGGAADLPRGVLPGPAPRLGDGPGTRYHELPIAIQDRSFNRDGSLFYPPSRRFFDGFGGPYIPDSDVSPIWNPELSPIPGPSGPPRPPCRSGRSGPRAAFCPDRSGWSGC
jgi:bilirubin oxidase